MELQAKTICNKHYVCERKEQRKRQRSCVYRECRGHSFTSQLSKGIFEPSEFSHYVGNVSNYIAVTISPVVCTLSQAATMSRLMLLAFYLNTSLLKVMNSLGIFSIFLVIIGNNWNKFLPLHNMLCHFLASYNGFLIILHSPLTCLLISTQPQRYSYMALFPFIMNFCIINHFYKNTAWQAPSFSNI